MTAKSMAACLLALLLCACTAPVRAEAANYEISSYALYLTVQSNGDVRFREEIICSSPHAYEGFTVRVNLDGATGIEDVTCWADGEELPLLTDGAEAGYTGTLTDGVAEITITSPGSNDWRTFACAYTLTGLAQRYEDTGLLQRELVPAGRLTIFQNAAAMITLPRSDGEIVAYVDGPVDDIEVHSPYDTVSIGPVDVGADETLSCQILFPAEWLSETEPQPGTIGAQIKAERAAMTQAAQQQTNARRAEQYTAIGVYVALFVGLLTYAMRRYGVRKKQAAGGVDMSVLQNQPAALTAYAAHDEAGPKALAGALCELDGHGLRIARGENGHVLMTRQGGNEPNQPHQAAALDIVPPNGLDVTALTATAGRDDARRFEEKLAAFNVQVGKDAAKAGLTWGNDALLIIINFACILCGVALGFVLLLVGKRMLWEACGVAALMFLLTGLFGRVRNLTDRGEAIQLAAARAVGLEAADSGALSPAAALALGCDMGSGEQGLLYADLRTALSAAHTHCAAMRKGKSS